MALLPEEFEGRVIITWPRAINSLVNCATVTLTDADSGETIVSAMGVTVRVELHKPLIAEMTMLTDADGKPLPAGAPVVADGDAFRSGVFRWLVAEMRTAE